MAGNIFGKILTLKSFGESHGKAIGGILDGVPPGLTFSAKALQDTMDRRRPGQSSLTTERNEADEVEILSGIYEGKTTGMPIGMLIFNADTQSSDYSEIKKAFRPSHADFTYTSKYGMRDPAGGGRSSARETAIRVAAGYFAQKILDAQKVKIKAYVHAVGTVSLPTDYSVKDQWDNVENAVRCPDPSTASKMAELIKSAKATGDTLGGVVACEVYNCPLGLGEPVFDKLQADLAKAVLSINACKGFEYGSGFHSAQMKGSEHNDTFVKDGEKIVTSTNFSGGIQGGISNGMPIYFKAAFKPVSTINQDQQTIDDHGQPTLLKSKGRHDPCVLPRAVPIVEAMTALVLADHLLRMGSSQWYGNLNR